jgi:hypothetical protein
VFEDISIELIKYGKQSLKGLINWL